MTLSLYLPYVFNGILDILLLADIRFLFYTVTEKQKKEVIMADETKLTAELEELLDELKRLDKKKAAAIEIGGVGMGDTIALAIDNAKEFIGGALVAEAQKEAAEAAALADKLIDGQVVVAPGEDQNRIHGAEEEIQRIKDKLKKADELLDGDIPPNLRDDVARIEADIPEMVEDLGKAAIAAAAREVKALKKEIDDIKKGHKKNKGSKNGPGPTDDDKKSDSGSGTGGTGDSGEPGGNIDSIGDGGSRSEPAPLTIFVRSDSSVWAWARRTQTWIEQPFQTQIQEVKIIPGGLLVIAIEEAALFDTTIGNWLVVLNAAPQTLIEGDSS